MSGGGTSAAVAHWAPPAPSMASLPVDQSKTEPKPAYYKLQFGDDDTGFSYYVRTLAVMIGRNCEKPVQPPPPAITDPSVPSIPPLEEGHEEKEVKQEAGVPPVEAAKAEEEVAPPAAGVAEAVEEGNLGDVTIKIESGVADEPPAPTVDAPQEEMEAVEEAVGVQEERQGIPAVTGEEGMEQYLDIPGPSVHPSTVKVEPGTVVDDAPPPPPPPPPEKKSGPVERVDVDLGPLKSVSRNHAKIEYRSDLGHFCLEIYGRNGAWVDDRYYVKGSTVPLNQGSQIQVATRIFYFVLPPSPGGSPYDSSYESGAFEDLPYPYNLPPSEVGYAEFYGEGGPGPSSAEAYAARAAAAAQAHAAAAAAQAEVPAFRPFNAFAAPDGHGLGIEMDERWLRDWNGSESSGMGSSDDADSFDSSSDLSDEDDSDEDDSEDEESDEDDSEEDEDESEEEEPSPRHKKKAPPRIKLTLGRGTSSTEISTVGDDDGEEEMGSSGDDASDEETPESPVATKRGAKKPSKGSKKGAKMTAAAAKRLAAAEAAAKKPSAVKAAQAAKAEAKKGKKGKVEEQSESETAASASVKGDTPKKGRKTIAKKEPKKSKASAPSETSVSASVKPEPAPQTINDVLAKVPPPQPAPPRPAPTAATRPAQPTPIPRPLASSQNSNASSSEPPRPFYLTELIETPGRPGHIVVNVPIPPSGAGPRPPPGPLIGLDGNHFIGPPPIKPICTFATIIYTALSNLPRGRGTLGEVCNWVAGEWEWFRLNVDAGWQNSIRHNLSLNKAFLKVPRIPEDDPESKGSVWVIDPEEGPLFEERQRKDPGKVGDKIKSAEKRERDRQKVEERIKKQREAAAEAHAAQRAVPIQPQPPAQAHPHPAAHPPPHPAPTAAVRPVAPHPAPSATPGGPPPAGATAAAPRPIPQRAQPPIPPKPVLAPKTKITVTVTPLTPALRAKTIIASTDAAGNPMPFVCDGQALYLDPSSFGHLTEELISKLSTLGASGAVDVLSGWLSNKNKQKATQAKNAAAAAAANAAKGGVVRPVNGVAPRPALAAGARPGAPATGAAVRPSPPVAGKPGAAPLRPPASATGTAARPPAGGAKPPAAAGAVPKKPTGPPPPGAHLIPIISRIAEAANSGGDVNAVGPHASALLRYIRHVGVNIEMAVAERIWQTGVVPPLPKKVIPPAKSAVGAKVNGVAAKPLTPASSAPAALPGAVRPPPAGATATPVAANGPTQTVNGMKRKAEDQASAPAVAEADVKKPKVDAQAVAT